MQSLRRCALRLFYEFKTHVGPRPDCAYRPKPNERRREQSGVVMEDFPRVQQLLESGAFRENHFAAHIEASDPIIPALEYFLSLEQVTGFSGKFKDLKEKPLGPKTTNERRVQWASSCAELGAIYLLGKTLDIVIIGFDQKSPRATRSDSNCDVLVAINGQLTFIEVKRNAAEDKQALPEFLKESLAALALPYSMSTELVNRKYDCSNLSARLAELTQHVRMFENSCKTGRMARQPTPFDAGDDFRVVFGAKSDDPMALEFCLPVFTTELKPYLVGPGATGKDGKPMKPMTTQAAEKGADYLFCRTPTWGRSWEEIIDECFVSVTYRGGRTFFTTDSGLLDLRGIVLFSCYDNFCIVNNLNAKDGAWLVT